MNLLDEVPGLLAELAGRGLLMNRVTFNSALWDPAPRRMTVEGRVVRLGSFTTLEPTQVSLTGSSYGPRLDLLVIPSDTSEQLADAVMRHVAAVGDRATATQLLTGTPPAGPARTQ
jgi:hypothetical protein